jgi:membrane associated rhomboid family serine protease
MTTPWNRTAGFGNPSRPMMPGRSGLFPPVIKALLIANGVVFLLTGILLAPFSIEGVSLSGALLRVLALWPWEGGFLPWQPLTYQFLHGSFFHLLFNMLGLWMFGMELENVWGSKKFLAYYLLGGVAAGLTHMLVGPLVGQLGPTVGASGAVFAVLVAFAMLFPDRPIYIYFLLPVKAKYLVACYIGLELFYGVTGTGEGVAHFAHLGGALFGLLFMLGELNILPVRAWWSALRPNAPTGPARRGPDRGGEIRDARFYDIRTGRPQARPPEEEITQELVDRILDKISAGGYQSLTDEEKRILNEASRKIH